MEILYLDVSLQQTRVLPTLAEQMLYVKVKMAITPSAIVR